MSAAAPARHAPFALPALLLGGVAIGFSPILVRLSELGPVATALHRVLLALPLLWLWQRLERRQPADARGALAALALPGLFFTGDLLFWHWSIAATSVANATLLANFAPIVVVIGAWLILRERITGTFLAGMALALLGAAMLIGSSLQLGQGQIVGDLFGLVTAAFYGAYMLAVAALRGRYGAGAIMFWSSIVMTALLLPAAWVEGGPLLPETLFGWSVLVALAWTAQAAGQGLVAYALGHLPASFSSLVILVQPVAAALLGWAVLGEGIGPLQFAGGAVVLAGILVARRASAVAQG